MSARPDRFRLFSVVAQSPDGKEIKKRLTPAAYLGIVAATNFKQRVRAMLEYYHADAHNFAVAGTPSLTLGAGSVAARLFASWSLPPLQR